MYKYALWDVIESFKNKEKTKCTKSRKLTRAASGGAYWKTNQTAAHVVPWVKLY